jgi:hypothetical protein
MIQLSVGVAPVTRVLAVTVSSIFGSSKRLRAQFG